MVREHRLHGPGENKELAYEAVQHGQADDGQPGNDEHGCYPWQLRGEAAVVAHVVGAVALVEQAEQHKQRRSRERFVQDLVDAAAQSRNRESEDAQDDETEMAERYGTYD